MPDSKNGSPSPSNLPNVYAVHGAEPEVQAYAMAKYSRSALSMKESLKEINEQKAEKFLNTFYFQYGHRSIADLAHIAFAIEKLSILAAIVLVDEQRWDGQERSTRYQDFKRSGYYTPEFGDDDESRRLYRETVEFLFSEYEEISELMWRSLAERTPKPDDMKPEAYERTLRARAFDISRYLLPLATNTSLGQIVNARTLEAQISRLLSHTHGEVRALGELLKEAAREPAYNVSQASFRELVEQIRALNPELGRRAESLLLKEVRVSPTLVKYANASDYETGTRKELTQAARELMKEAAIEPAKTVELLDDDPLELELPTTLLYQHCHYSYPQVRQRVESLSPRQREEVIELGVKHRSRHDELLRAYCAGQRFRFDILMDVGGFRDMHRHRRCVQILQPFAGTLHAYETPDDLAGAGLRKRYDAAMQKVRDAERRFRMPTGPEGASDYMVPLAFRCRALFKMDLAEAVYISELRTTPAGHFSYRNVGYAMYEEVARRHPALARYFRVSDVREPVDLLKR
jgi:thymidylate synthase ThyX